MLNSPILDVTDTPARGGDFNVRLASTGGVIIHAHVEDAAALAGREQFGDIPALQEKLQDAIADAWYAADCPPEYAGKGEAAA